MLVLPYISCVVRCTWCNFVECFRLQIYAGELLHSIAEHVDNLVTETQAWVVMCTLIAIHRSSLHPSTAAQNSMRYKSLSLQVAVRGVWSVFRGLIPGEIYHNVQVHIVFGR